MGVGRGEGDAAAGRDVERPAVQDQCVPAPGTTALAPVARPCHRQGAAAAGSVPRHGQMALHSRRFRVGVGTCFGEQDLALARDEGRLGPVVTSLQRAAPRAGLASGAGGAGRVLVALQEGRAGRGGEDPLVTRGFVLGCHCRAEVVVVPLLLAVAPEGGQAEPAARGVRARAAARQGVPACRREGGARKKGINRSVLLLLMNEEERELIKIFVCKLTRYK